MDDATYKAQLQRKAQLLAELKAVEEFIRAYENLFKVTSSGVPSAATPPSEAPRRRERNVLSPRRIAELAREEILKRGHPMTRGELVEAFDARGIPLAGRDKAKNVGTILWRFPNLFLNVPGRGYWPKDQANADLNYDPRRAG